MSKGKVTEARVADLIPDDKNFNKGTEYGNALLEKSFQKFGAGRSILLDKNNRIIAGNKAAGKYGELGGEKVIVVETDGDTLVAVKRTDVDLDSQAGRELALADNATQRADLEWDTEVVKEVSEQWEIDAAAWGVRTEDWTPTEEEAEIERKRREFEGRIAAGEISEEDEEYQEFLEKFKLKKTTDDCYTPAAVYDAVADWVADKYGISKAKFVRPFYPGGDYQKEDYRDGAVVVDNPPFSILAEIVRYYNKNGVRFFLFAPNLTILNYDGSCAIGVGATVTYENGANVQTSFITNLEPEGFRAKSAPDLFAKVDDANRKNLAATKRTVPKFEYPSYVLTAFLLTQFAKYGVTYDIKNAEAQIIRELDCQKEYGKGIYGTALLISEAKKVEMEAKKVEMEAKKVEMEAKKVEMEAKKGRYIWELSDREKAIVAKLGK